MSGKKSCACENTVVRLQCSGKDSIDSLACMRTACEDCMTGGFCEECTKWFCCDNLVQCQLVTVWEGQEGVCKDCISKGLALLRETRTTQKHQTG